jgi:hypothetical protein
MDVQQAINLGIMDRFAEEGIEFTQPTRPVNGAPDHVGSVVTASPPA